jgi:hypothetical protein
VSEVDIIDRVDVDGALAESRAGLSRAELLVAGLTTAGSLLGLARPARAAELSATDADVLNYALSLEYLQAAFYTESERSKAITGKAGEAAKVVGAVERAHVAAFVDLLGDKAIKRPQPRSTSRTPGRRSPRSSRRPASSRLRRG